MRESLARWSVAQVRRGLIVPTAGTRWGRLMVVDVLCAVVAAVAVALGTTALQLLSASGGVVAVACTAVMVALVGVGLIVLCWATAEALVMLAIAARRAVR